MRIRLPVFVVCLGLACSSLYAERHALVIGVDRYEHLPKQAQLEVAVRDARLLGQTLRELSPSFHVTVLEDVTQRDAEDTLENFIRDSEGSECALVYFAGHGVEFHGDNYLLMRDTEVDGLSAEVRRAKRQLANDALDLQTVLDDMESTGAQVKVVIIDACRNNPLEVEVVGAGGKRSRSLIGQNAGLAQVSAPSGMLVAYAADAGQEANDGLFTPILAKHLKTPDMDILRVFAATREEVLAESRKLASNNRGVAHEPADYNKLNLAGTRFVFHRGVGGTKDSGATLEAMRTELERVKRKLAMKTKDPLITPSIPKVSPTPLSRGLTNSLGMQFLPIPGTAILLSVWETRVQDYAAYAAENSGVDDQWEDSEYGGHKQGPDHPVVNVSWDDAQAFCQWLSKREGKTYRLPTDHEWSIAMGIGQKEDPAQSPKEKDYKISGYPWGAEWPPPNNSGNFAEMAGYIDLFPFTAPVSSFPLNHQGIKDLSGNVYEWVEDLYEPGSSSRVVRGGSWLGDFELYLSSSYRRIVDPEVRFYDIGFRCVLADSAGR